MTKEYRTDEKVPSVMFVNSLSGFGVGSRDIECGWCGREHLCVDPGHHYYDDKEDADNWRQYCLDRKEECPDGTILHYDTDSVSAQELNSIMFVIDCPCNGLSRYETFIWAERDTIRAYLKKRIDQEYQWAEQELTKNKLAGIS